MQTALLVTVTELVLNMENHHPVFHVGKLSFFSNSSWIPVRRVPSEASSILNGEDKMDLLPEKPALPEVSCTRYDHRYDLRLTSRRALGSARAVVYEPMLVSGTSAVSCSR